MSMSPPSGPDQPQNPNPTSDGAAPGGPQKKKPSVSAKFWTGVVGVPILLALLYYGGWPLFLAATLTGIIGVEEFYRNVARKGIHASRPVGWACTAGLLTAAHFVTDSYTWLWGFMVICLAGSVFLSMIVQFWRAEGSSVIANTGATVFGVAWVGLLFSFFLRLRTVQLSEGLDVPPDGLVDRMGAIVLVVLAVWMQDNAAQLCGRAFGTTKPWPDISPNKTLEGCAAGLLACLTTTVVVGTLLGLNTIHMVLLGLSMGVLGQLGDFCKSMIKREVGVKDFGSILPGHGGVLDRFDSLLFAMPIGYLYFLLFVLPVEF